MTIWDIRDSDIKHIITNVMLPSGKENNMGAAVWALRVWGSYNSRVSGISAFMMKICYLVVHICTFIGEMVRDEGIYFFDTFLKKIRWPQSSIGTAVYS